MSFQKINGAILIFSILPTLLIFQNCAESDENIINSGSDGFSEVEGNRRIIFEEDLDGILDSTSDAEHIIGEEAAFYYYRNGVFEVSPEAGNNGSKGIRQANSRFRLKGYQSDNGGVHVVYLNSRKNYRLSFDAKISFASTSDTAEDHLLLVDDNFDYFDKFGRKLSRETVIDNTDWESFEIFLRPKSNPPSGQVGLNVTFYSYNTFNFLYLDNFKFEEL